MRRDEVFPTVPDAIPGDLGDDHWRGARKILKQDRDALAELGREPPGRRDGGSRRRPQPNRGRGAGPPAGARTAEDRQQCGMHGPDGAAGSR